MIKIERPAGGDAARGYDRTVRGESSHFVWVNRSKDRITSYNVCYTKLLRANHLRFRMSPNVEIALGASVMASGRPGELESVELYARRDPTLQVEPS